MEARNQSGVAAVTGGGARGAAFASGAVAVAALVEGAFSGTEPGGTAPTTEESGASGGINIVSI